MIGVISVCDWGDKCDGVISDWGDKCDWGDSVMGYEEKGNRSKQL